MSYERSGRCRDRRSSVSTLPMAAAIRCPCLLRVRCMQARPSAPGGTERSLSTAARGGGTQGWPTYAWHAARRSRTRRGYGVDMLECRIGALCSCLANIAGLTPRCKPCRLSPAPTWSWSREALLLPLPQGGDLPTSAEGLTVPSAGVPRRDWCILSLCSHSSAPASDSAPPS